MPGLYSKVKTVITGEIITAADRNTEHDNHITNHVPQQMDDYSTNVAQMQTTTDPYPGASESLATSLSGELERIRFVIKQITGKAQWYHDPDGSLPSGFTLGSVLFATTGGAIGEDNANFFWDDTNNRLGIGTATPSQKLHILNTTVNSSPTIRIQNDARAWDIITEGLAGGDPLVIHDFTAGADRFAIDSVGTVFAYAGDVQLGTAVDTNGVQRLILVNDAQEWRVILDGADGDKFKIRDETAASDALVISPGGGLVFDTIGCLVYGTGNQSITTATETTVNWAGEQYDNDTMHDNVTNNSRITFNTAGKYELYTHIRWGSNSTGNRTVKFRLNGSTDLLEVTQGADGSTVTVSQLFLEWDFAATDYVEVRVFQDSGGNLNVLNGSPSPLSSFFRARRVAS